MHIRMVSIVMVIAMDSYSRVTYYPVKPYIKEFCTVIYLISLTTGLISRYHLRKKSKEYIVSDKRSFDR